jgi:hypothetical protein
MRAIFFFFFGGTIGPGATNNGLALWARVKFGPWDPGRHRQNTIQRNAQLHALAGQCGAAGLTDSVVTIAELVVG